MFPKLSIATSHQTLIPPQKAVPISYFGIHNHRFHDSLERPFVRFGAWRLWDAGVGWSQLQPSKDRWDFRRLDQAILTAKGNSQAVHMIFGRTPRWAAANPDQPSFYGPGESSPPRMMTDFANFVSRVVIRYSGRIDAYEVWNEPASAGMFAGSVQQMIEMTELVAKEVRAHDPAAKVICPSPAKHESLNWFRQFVQAGGTQFCDVVGYHFYTDSGQPEDRLSLVAAVQGILQDHGVSDKPIWDTESGRNLDSTRPEHPSASAVAHMARWMVLTWASGIERFYWYSWDHTRLGFKVPGGARHHDAIKALEKVQSWMLGSIFHSCRRTDALWGCALTLAGGRPANIWWTSDNSSISMAVPLMAQVEGLGWGMRATDSQSVTVNGDPILVVEPPGLVQAGAELPMVVSYVPFLGRVGRHLGPEACVFHAHPLLRLSQTLV